MLRIRREIYGKGLISRRDYDHDHDTGELSAIATGTNIDLNDAL